MKSIFEIIKENKRFLITRALVGACGLVGLGIFTKLFGVDDDGDYEDDLDSEEIIDTESDDEE